jgi:hypothetical protein
LKDTQSNVAFWHYFVPAGETQSVDFVKKADLSFAMMADGSEILPATYAFRSHLKL